MYSDGSRVVRQVGERTAGGAYAKYQIVNYEVPDGATPDDKSVLAFIPFQHDVIPKVGVVGATNECLLAIVIDRLEAFQSNGFGCVENEIALNACKSALKVLEYRTELRKQRNVEGKHEK
ncbi:hypothetical protein KS4_23280 [Poriferisphaera corsica]|uniref:Acb2/Tad1 hairpin domain-containing protein n=2 Tax=Poriferisphaera corsica TaxID=2528020 RepID=A0A517YVP9_9BACT|nr:hypothetical protein KS4_23280 [Poriferisphaera corsica]